MLIKKGMILNRVYYFIIVLFILAIPSIAFSELKIISPVNYSISESGSIIVTGTETAGDTESITITLKGKVDGAVEEFSETVDIDERVFSLDIELYPGENQIIIGKYNRRVFYADETLTPPSSYKKINYHQVIFEGCSDCHFSDERGFKLLDGIGQACDRCHPMDMRTITVRRRKKSGKIVKRKKRIIYKYMHKTVANRKCLFCHTPHSSENKYLLKKSQVKDLCLGCHSKIRKALDRNDKVHLPQMAFACTMCHDPHASNHKYLFKTSLKFICYQCHETILTSEKIKVKESIHMPVKNGLCYLCHDIHFSEKKGFLNNAPLHEICTKCHRNKEYTKDMLLEDSCYACHKPHSADYDSLLIKDNVEICKDCHTEIYNGKFAHSAIKTEKGCGACHNAHKLEKVDKLKGLCFKCHYDKKKLAISHGGFDIGIKLCSKCHSTHYSAGENLLLPNQHKPFKEKKCYVCHDEGEEGELTLTKNGSELCYQCHDSVEQTAEKKPYKSLHGLVKKGECIYCHSPHASVNDKLLLKPKGKLCLKCHDYLTAKKAAVHQPAS